MSKVFIIKSGVATQQLGETDLPFKIGGTTDCQIYIASYPNNKIAALIGYSEGYAFVQGANDNNPIYLNNECVNQSSWLKSGDVIEIDQDTLVIWTVKSDRVDINIVPNTYDNPQSTASKINSKLKVRATPIDTTHIHQSLKKDHRWMKILIASLFGGLLLASLFVLIAVPVNLKILPQPDKITVKGSWPVISFFDHRLALPGQYRLGAQKPGYYPLINSIVVSKGASDKFQFNLKEKPGKLIFKSSLEVPFEVKINDRTQPMIDDMIELPRGKYDVTLSAERYLPKTMNIDVSGLDIIQQIDFMLQPAWANVSIFSEPPGASVMVDDKSLGVAPLTTTLLQGKYQLSFKLEGYQPLVKTEALSAGETKIITASLFITHSELVLESEPKNAQVTVNGENQGVTPTTVLLAPTTIYNIKISKAGYLSKQISLSLLVDEIRTLKLKLDREYGTIKVVTDPPDARIWVDGIQVEAVNNELQLTTIQHQLTIKKAGYDNRIVKVIPKPGQTQEMSVKLKESTRIQEPAHVNNDPPKPNTLTDSPQVTTGTILSPLGDKLKLVKTNQVFTLGASRREAGRRANERIYDVQFSRPFYISTKEVTNAQFQQFDSAHNSGAYDRADLSMPTQPVVNVSWNQAAKFCNWLSAKANLKPAYTKNNNQMIAVPPISNGYRLPSEAEWAYTARKHKRPNKIKYPWAGTYPPAQASGNYADKQISDTLADVIMNYDDGYRGTAPVGSFASGPNGFYDFGGNVAEWVHDFYKISTGSNAKPLVDPMGPLSGSHHVIRGSSWRHGNITELRLSYRDYSAKPRYDLGFRVARYVY